MLQADLVLPLCEDEQVNASRILPDIWGIGKVRETWEGVLKGLI
jgi:hypothetical protein